MNNKLFKKNIRNIERQRNIFLLLAIIIVISNLFLSIKNLLRDEKIILVPGLNQDIWVKKILYLLAILRKQQFYY